MLGRVALIAVAVIAATTSGCTAASPSGDTAAINGGARFQAITGFGVFEGCGQATKIMKATAATRLRVLNLLYSTSSGAGLTMLRNEISADPGDTIEPAAPAKPSARPKYVPLSSIGQDQGQLWLAQTIKAKYGVTDIFADAWSPPPYMKVNYSVDNGGALCGVPGATCSSGDWRQGYANYLKQYAADYAAAGVPLSYIGPENEAHFGPAEYDGMTLTPAQTASLLDVLGPTMASSGLPTKVECCATQGWDFAQRYAAAVESDPAANAATMVFTSHGYTRAPTTHLSGWSKPAWETEWSGFGHWNPAWDNGRQSSGLDWARRIFAGLDQSDLSAFLYWWGTSTPSFNGDNESLIQFRGSSVVPSGRLWAFANFSRFVRPGAVRIGATTPNATLTLDAFKNTDNTITVVALNTARRADPVTFSLKGTSIQNGAVVTPYLTNSTSQVSAQPTTTVSGGAFTSTLPARSLVTFQIGHG